MKALFYSVAFVVVVLLFSFGLAKGQTASYTSGDVGAVAKSGTASYNTASGTYTLSGCGADIWGTADAFHFVYQTIPGDGELTARVVSVQDTNAWAKAGVMIRQDTTAGAVQGMTVVTPGEGVAFQYRSATGGSSINVQTTGPSAPYWVRIVKDAAIVTSYQSADGVNWTLMGFTRLPFTGSVQIGLCVCSHNTSQLCTATFDNITLTSTPTFSGPMPWLDQDIGAVSSTETGVLHYENSLWTVYGSGTDIWGTADAFHYVYEPLTGNGQIIAEVLGQTNTNSWAKAGIMLRQDLTPGSPQVSLFATPGNGIDLQSRAVENGSSGTLSIAPTVLIPSWLKLARSGNQVFASTSADGITWTTVASQTISMSNTAYIGLAVCSHNVSSTSLAVFANVQTLPPILTAEAVSDTTVNLYWPPLSTPDDVFEYALYRNGQEVATSPISSFEDVQLSPNTIYTYQVTALGATNNALATSNVLTVTTKAPLLPAPWQHEDIGAPGAILLGGYSQEDLATQTYTLVGSGADIWGTEDAFQYAWQSLNGNGQIIARVDSETPTNSWTKAGIMLRQNGSPNALQALLALTPGNGLTFQARTASGASDLLLTDLPATGPIWLKVIRQGNVINAFQSPDGIAWTYAGTETIPFSTTIEVGLALTAHNADALATAIFDNVSITTGTPSETTHPNPPKTLSVVAVGDVSDTISWSAASDAIGVTSYQVYRNGLLINSTSSTSFTDTGLTPSTSYSYTIVALNYGGLLSVQSVPLSVSTTPSNLPSPWTHTEIGTVAYAGNASYSAATFTLGASGIDIWNNSDSFGFIEQSVPGNTQIMAQVFTESAPSVWTKSGVMIRSTIDPGSPQASVFITPGNGVVFQYRTAQGMNSSTVEGALTAKAPLYVDLIRSGTVVTGSYSVDGINWSTIGNVTLPLGTSALVGLASTSHDNGVLATSTFTDVQVSSSTSPPSIPASWLQLYFGNASVNPSTLSPAGDGFTILQEYQMGRNPAGFLPGTAPVITIVSGNNQTGAPLTNLPNALIVQVTNASGHPLINAPLTFNTVAGELLTSPAAPSGALSLAARTNAQGQASAFLQLPMQGGPVTVASDVTIDQTFASGGQTISGPTFTETCQAERLFAGSDSSFSTTFGGTFGWGADNFGQALVSPVQPFLATPTLTGLSPLAIVSSGNHTLILNADHTVSAVGDNYFGQLGLGDSLDRSVPIPIAGLTNVIALATGREHGLALLQNGTVYAWGGNCAGQLGRPISTGSLVPVKVAGLQNIVAIASGQLHCLALDASGNVWTWGDNRFGQLGNNSIGDLIAPTQITALSNISAISAGDYTSFAVNKSGGAWSWGCNSSGALGQGSQSNSLTPQPIPIGSQLISQISPGSEFTLLLTSSGNLYGTGANFDGQLDLAVSSPITAPFELPLAGVQQVATGNDHALAQSPQGVFSWGFNQFGQLGNGTTVNGVTTNSAPVTIP